MSGRSSGSNCWSTVTRSRSAVTSWLPERPTPTWGCGSSTWTQPIKSGSPRSSAATPPDRSNVRAVSADSIKRVEATDVDELLVLMRAYCDFYEVSPPDGNLLAIARALIADPVNDGVQLIARDPSGRAVGFATVYWTWSTTSGCRIGIMNDLFVAADSRG